MCIRGWPLTFGRMPSSVNPMPCRPTIRAWKTVCNVHSIEKVLASHQSDLKWTALNNL